MLVLLLACAQGPCEGLAPGAPRDQCLARRIAAEGAALDMGELRRMATLIADPAVRASAVSRWAGTRHGPVDDAERDALCATLADADRPACQRRFPSH